jgi:redox-sensitive bicupin YhaK (pirin superfamily)
MTAGAGVVHSEMPASVFLRTGGRMHGFQLWVNLPRRDKLMAPRYQEVPAARIPAVRDREGVSVKVIAGEALGARAVIDTRTPILYLHFTLAPGARARQPLPPDWNAFAYVFSGRGLVGREERPVIDGQGAILATDGELISLAAPAGAHAPLELLLVAGLPLREPVVRYGPFVMNSEEEILQAVEDFRAGRLGRRS